MIKIVSYFVIAIACCSWLLFASPSWPFQKRIPREKPTLTKAEAFDDEDCAGSMWKHVYRAERLQIIDACMTVKGTIDDVRPEHDGDYHINVRLDPGQEKLLNQKNKNRQHGCLVIEIIYVKPPTQKSALDAYKGYTNNVYVPKRGEHVSIRGPYVLDNEGGHGWMEIHPVVEVKPLDL